MHHGVEQLRFFGSAVGRRGEHHRPQSLEDPRRRGRLVPKAQHQLGPPLIATRVVAEAGAVDLQGHVIVVDLDLANPHHLPWLETAQRGLVLEAAVVEHQPLFAERAVRFEGNAGEAPAGDVAELARGVEIRRHRAEHVVATQARVPVASQVAEQQRLATLQLLG